jgi:uncharacterized protein
VRVERHLGIGGIEASTWRAVEPPDFPFFDYEFLLALERSGSVGGKSGWSPVYLACWDGGRLLGVLPLYSKTNSYGEYVFDWEWAHAYHEHGIPYYPKLLSAVPFTPATGPKLLVRGDLAPAEHERVVSALLGAAAELGDDLGVSSTHALFLPDGDLEAFSSRGYAVRYSMQFHWHNRGYESFEDYLAALEGKRRRQVARERRQLEEEGLRIERLTGEELGPEVGTQMYRFYMATASRKWGEPYLTRPFFEEVFETMRDRALFVVASDEGTRRPVAGALFFYKGAGLFGRHWGAFERRRNLHFELCYYQGIEHSIQDGFARFEAGAQGEHKLARGFLPVLTRSAHRIHHPAFRRAIERYLDEERELVADTVEAYAQHDPYR